MKDKTKQIEVLLHNIRSVYNAGSIFRTADALGVNKIYLSGYTPTPLDNFNKPRKDFAKVALGAEKTIRWEYINNPFTLIKKLKTKHFQIIGLEQSEKSIDYKKVKINFPALFVLGNEVDGIEPKILKQCSVVAEISMKGKKESLNVSVAFGVGLFRMLGL